MSLNNFGRHPFLLFLRVMLQNPTGVSAIAPSSQRLAWAMTHDLKLNPDEAVLELGPGTGALTGQIQKIIPASNAYMGIELESRFVNLLQQEFPHLRFVNDTVARVQELHRQAGMVPAKVIISGLSVTALSRDVQKCLIDNLDQLLEPGAIFRMFQYVHAYPLPAAIRFRRQMRQIFSQYHRSAVILKNLPPAFVLTWIR